MMPTEASKWTAGAQLRPEQPLPCGGGMTKSEVSA